MTKLFLALILAFGLTAFADDEPKPKEEKSKMPMNKGYPAKAPGYAKTSAMRSAKPGPARAAAAKSMARPSRPARPAPRRGR